MTAPEIQEDIAPANDVVGLYRKKNEHEFSTNRNIYFPNSSLSLILS